MKAASFSPGRLSIFANAQRTISLANSSTLSAGSHWHESNQENRKTGNAFLDSVLFLRSCVPHFLFWLGACDSDRDWFEEIYRIVRARRDREANSNGGGHCDRPSPGDGRHNHSLASASQRTDRRLSRIYRHNRAGNFKAAGGAHLRANCERAGQSWNRNDGTARIQQYLRARDAAQSRRATRHSHNQRSSKTSG